MKPCDNNQRLRRSLLGMLLTAMILAGTLPSIADVETATRVYDPAGLSQTTVMAPDGNSYMRVEWAGLDLTETPGKPQLPVEYIRFLVPVYTKVTGVSVKVGSETSSQLSVPVYPGQVPMTTNYTGPEVFTQPDADAYSQSYPIRAEYVDEGFLDGCNHIVTVAVYPVNYDPTANEISSATDITVSLEYKTCPASELAVAPLFPPVRSRYLDFSKIVVNSAKSNNAQYVPRRKKELKDSDFYFIITPRNLKDAFKDLVAWKRQKGYRVFVECIEDIYDNYKIGSKYDSEEVLDSAMSLRCYLKDKFLQHGMFFCLLAGDWRTPMPIRKATPSDSIIITEYDKTLKKSIPVDTIYVTDKCEETVPTDMYFAELNNSAKLVKRKYMSLYSIPYDSLSSYNSIYIGRLLCATPQEIDNYVSKLLLYEANPGYGDNDYLSSALFFEECNKHWEGDSVVHSGCIIRDSERVRNECDFFETITLFQDKAHQNWDSKGKYVGNAEGPSAPEIIEAMRTVGFSSWHGHGSPYGVATSAEGHIMYATDDYIGKYPYNTPNAYRDLPHSGLNNLNNEFKPSIVYSISCDNAPFDKLNWDGFEFDGTNLGHAFTTAYRCGGPAAIMNTRIGRTFTSASIELKFIQNIKNHRKIGMAFRGGLWDYHAPNGKKETVRRSDATIAANLIGEPELEMWLGKPLEFNINLIPNQSGVSIVGGLPNGTTCILNDGTDELSKTIASGSQFANPFSGEYCFSLWKTDYLPIVTLLGQKGSLNISKRYIVRNALLGNIDSEGNNENCTYSVTDGGNLSVHAIDNIAVYQGFSVENGGVVEFDCDNTVNLNGGIVRKGGTLVIKAKDVKMTSGFKVELGGILKIINN